MVDNGERLALVERRTEELLVRLREVEDLVGATRSAVRDAPPATRGVRPLHLRSTSETGQEQAIAAEGVRPLHERSTEPERPGGWLPVAGAVARTAAQTPTKASPAAAPRPGLEDLLAGRVLAWAGGLAVLVGIVLLFAVAVSRGWIGEGMRTLMGALGSFTLVVAGAWLHEHRGRTDAALAATAAGIAGLFATAVVASRHYELIPTSAGLLMALATGAAATWLAVRWETQGIAALGILGGLAAPVVIGVGEYGGTVAIVFVATLSAAAVCVRFGWEWIAGAAFVITAGQWLAWLGSEPGTTEALACLVGFGAVNAAMAVGFELRRRADGVRPVAVLLLALNAFALAGSGWYVLGESVTWIAALGLVLVALGLALVRDERGSRAVGLLACALGTVLLDIAIGQVLNGLVLAFAWAAIAAAFAPLLARVRPGGLTEGAVGAGLGAHLSLALGHALTVEAPPEAVASAGTASLEATAAIAALAAVCFVSGRVLADRSPWRIGLDTLGLAAVAYLAAMNLDGAALAAAFAAGAILLAEVARRTGDRVAPVAAGAFTALALGHALVFEARPDALVDGSPDLIAAAIALIAGALAAWRCAVMVGELRTRESEDALAPPPWRELAAISWIAASLALLHLASISVVTAGGGGPRAQTLLSVLWGAVGVTALIAGLLRDIGPLRTGALTLLLAALAKVFLYDLATLTPIARVASFIVLGLLLLLGAFAWQRIRPRPLPDLREVPPGLQG
ncbi:MAG: hypothetical protein AVDCRST_MAG85-553 [uncultured Solirubrobacteraceae bacterium]|uniref:DUF2339 domain-containing protein n=1 Tax=uncultured Solirubrobacteraceae bacterium TaxID=1162706 RepID=A0A6J4RZI6_9ACTN|nr:MAG: hypothetical protein AVDCRST_MAG85-553 [uncultured Solirubrobacteraceae bacterium]